MSRTDTVDTNTSGKTFAIRYLLFIAGLGGLLFGIDIGIIGGALPYLESTAVRMWKPPLSAQDISFVVAAVLLGGALSSLFAGMLSDLFGRRTIMFASGLLFVSSVPTIALSTGNTQLLLGRLLQGISGGLVAVSVPLYLAECLPARNRGTGTAIFQWLLTFGLVVAALIGLYFGRYVEGVRQGLARGTASAAELLQAEDVAWRSMFWMSTIPGIVFCIGTLFIAESSRWLFRRGRKEAARAALLRTRSQEEADREMQEMEEIERATAEEAARATGRDSLFSRKYVLPFLLACIVLACTQATGVNSILQYVVNILIQAGLPAEMAHMADVALKVLNCLATVIAVVLVDRQGRKFLLMVGSGGIVICLAMVGGLFYSAESGRVDRREALQALVKGDALSVTVDDALIKRIGGTGGAAGEAAQLTVLYAYGPFTNVVSRSTADPGKLPLTIARSDVVKEESSLEAFFRRLHLNPFNDPADGQRATLEIQKAMVGPVPGQGHGILVALALFGFMAFFAVGPGVCVWLALSELMPTRIRSNGMSIALLINQIVSTTFAAIFLPTVGRYGYAAMFFLWCGNTIIYFLTATFLLPETKGKTLEEIELYFSGSGTPPDRPS
jgi:SP family myo-inositol transporter-like MFS transporter 13